MYKKIQDGEPESDVGKVLIPAGAVIAVSQTELIKWLMDVDSHQACTQIERVDFPMCQQDTNGKEASLLAEMEESLPFPDGWVNFNYQVHTTCKSRPTNLDLKALIDLSDVQLAQEQE